LSRQKYLNRRHLNTTLTAASILAEEIASTAHMSLQSEFRIHNLFTNQS